MAVISLFGQEAQAIVKPISVKTPSRKKATITLSLGNYSCDVDRGKGTIIPNGTEFISVSFDGYQEGSSSPCDSEQEAQAQVEYLKNYYKDKYNITIIDKRKENIAKPKAKGEWKFEELAWVGETKPVAYVDFELEGKKIFVTKKQMKGMRKTKGDETRLLARTEVTMFVEGLEEVCTEFDTELKTEQEIKEFIDNEIEGSIVAQAKNRENIFFDTRRYFWKYENKEFKNIGWVAEV